MSYRVEKDVMATMRDGQTLRTDPWLPDGRPSSAPPSAASTSTKNPQSDRIGEHSKAFEGANPMASKHLVDPDLLPIVEQAPPLEPTTESLPELRLAVSGLRAPAPPSSGVTVEERAVPGPGGSAVRVLVYSPETPTRTGALLWLHAGGMVMGTPDMYEAHSRFLAERAGCVVIAVEYGLAPENPYPAGLEECYAVLGWAHGAADELSIPRGRIAVAGESGGGGLAVGLSLLARDRGELAVSAQFLEYPMLDDRTGTPAEPDPMPHAGEFVWTQASNRFAWGSVLGHEPGGGDVPIYASPGRAEDLGGLPPTFIGVGALDLFVGENLRLARGLIGDGVPTELHVYPGALHGFASFSEDAQVAKNIRRDFWDAVERHFRDGGFGPATETSPGGPEARGGQR